MTQTQIDKLFERIRAICLALPEAKEVEAWGQTREQWRARPRG